MRIREIRNKKVRQLGSPGLYIGGCGLLIVLLMVMYFLGYDHYRKNLVTYSCQDLKTKYTVINEEEVYEFMNSVFFRSDTILKDRREFKKIHYLSIKHNRALRKFIRSVDDTILTPGDKSFVKSQLVNEAFLWDQDRLLNAWCLTPRDLYEISEKDTIDYWVNFRKHFGENGHHNYSKPLFNKEKNIVIIVYTGQVDWLFGSGSIMLFRKENDKWRLIMERNLWIS